MPNWNEVILEIQQEQQKNPHVNPLDTVRRKYLKSVSKITGRNTIAYYSGWLQKPQVAGTAVNDKDKSGFMLAINKLDRAKGLDLILHTPGGDIAATESLVDYLYSMYDKDIRVIVPQISMSAGTMIALSAKEIVMGKHSNLGPIDPQMGGLACQAVLDEFKQAKEDIKQNPQSASLWQVIISKYHPTFLGACKQAIEWSEKMVFDWLENNMCKGDKNKVQKIIDTFANHKIQKSHSRHISKKECIDVGLTIINLEDNQDLQDAVLTTHHAFMHTFLNTYCVKIIENHNGVAYIEQAVQPQNSK
ncbi:SDH family Clp fold serine proteinase [Abyssalbus ytuae]|uniref:ATP-dependent Clp protease proteolytic subunit n=1 Tax=Abyssalbus ytuae TaxID=2926907 RepID=A0A9E7CTV2_9FLAO|nr:ATP-dependent Clp protease proteolytic subunit [Abyssalbus ytuae]UOB18761.1 ATP-dependent Clp protease proteolytic subunit [Abyssalbus ytuae]